MAWYLITHGASFSFISVYFDCVLFNDAVSNLDCIASNDGRLMSNQLGRVWKTLEATGRPTEDLGIDYLRAEI